jgi:hypothetical protein
LNKKLEQRVRLICCPLKGKHVSKIHCFFSFYFHIKIFFFTTFCKITACIFCSFAISFLTTSASHRFIIQLFTWIINILKFNLFTTVLSLVFFTDSIFAFTSLKFINDVNTLLVIINWHSYNWAWSFLFFFLLYSKKKKERQRQTSYEEMAVVVVSFSRPSSLPFSVSPILLTTVCRYTALHTPPIKCALKMFSLPFARKSIIFLHE